MGKNATLDRFYFFSGLNSKDDASLVINFDSNAAQHGQALKDPDATDPSGSEATNPEEDTPKITEPAAEGEQLGPGHGRALWRHQKD